ncbi:YkgJ family cysteine cluster protein [Halodesulfovibrio sp. MK-HDV]|jgi:uncharacterized protein|uniref:YkgJ family cysteine cluster protein n=1 Tax=Halodesulfovibrio sp. MK-HDV TaxID=2599925 RepID=UPI00137075D8|nr:YkgJ family cysteine cluster protein [Halodesulfovibrio sp. MK-HDV]KAF1076032.1 hypothetical protein MKHDV_01468 [Halodesulfovibrio sp. MK-HDV]
MFVDPHDAGPDDDSAVQDTLEYLESLPQLADSDTFSFACHPKVSCFNACCRDLSMPLSPYDVLRLRQGLGLDSTTFIKEYAVIEQYPNSGFPVLFLKMTDNIEQECPFLCEKGCTVYEDRSAACRAYPLGRATHLDENGEIVEQFVVVQEDHCKGFAESKEWTAKEWLKDQGLEEYNYFADRYMSIISRFIDTDLELTQKRVQMALLAFYQLDHFKGFMEDMNLMDRVNVPEGRREKIMTDEKERLLFAMEWMELILFGTSTTLSHPA